MGAQLHLIAPLLKECLATPKVDPEVKLKIFTTLSTVLLRRDVNFKTCDNDKLEAFLKIVLEGKIDLSFKMIYFNLNKIYEEGICLM